jgi:hypothetical protein
LLDFALDVVDEELVDIALENKLLVALLDLMLELVIELLDLRLELSDELLLGLLLDAAEEGLLNLDDALLNVLLEIADAITELLDEINEALDPFAGVELLEPVIDVTALDILALFEELELTMFNKLLLFELLEFATDDNELRFVACELVAALVMIGGLLAPVVSPLPPPHAVNVTAVNSSKIHRCKFFPANAFFIQASSSCKFFTMLPLIYFNK